MYMTIRVASDLVSHATATMGRLRDAMRRGNLDVDDMALVITLRQLLLYLFKWFVRFVDVRTTALFAVLSSKHKQIVVVVGILLVSI